MSTTTWAAGIRQVHAEAAGVMHLHLITKPMALEIIIAAVDGDPYAGRLALALSETIAQIERQPRCNPSLCLCCDRAVRRGSHYLAYLLVPGQDSATLAIGGGICKHCAADHPNTLDQQALTALKGLWPDARLVTIHPVAGGAS